MKLAKIRHRVIASIVDNIIIIGVAIVAFSGTWSNLIFASNKDEVLNSIFFMRLIKSGMVYALFLLFYYMMVPMFYRGQTLGKRIFKIKVVGEDGKDVNYKILFFREAICRILVRTLSFGISSCASFIIMLLRDDKKSFADVFARTKVIDVKEEFKNVYSTQ